MEPCAQGGLPSTNPHQLVALPLAQHTQVAVLVPILSPAGEPPSHLPWRLKPRDLHFPVEFPWIYKRAGFDLQSLTMVVNLDCDQIRPEHELAVISGAKWPLAWKIIFIGFLLHLHSFSCMLWLCLCWGGISRITGVSNPDGLHPFYHLAGARGAFKGEQMFFRPSLRCHSSNMFEAVFPKA